jgi:hypothetical protein
MLTRHHLHCLAFSNVHSSSISRNLVSSSKHLHQAVWILSSRQALKPDMCYLPSIVADLCLHLPYALGDGSPSSWGPSDPRVPISMSTILCSPVLLWSAGASSSSEGSLDSTRSAPSPGIPTPVLFPAPPLVGSLLLPCPASLPGGLAL